MKSQRRSKTTTPSETYRERAERLLRKWQRILRLQDWDVSITYGRWHEVHNGAHAHLHHSWERHEAHIVVRDPDDQKEPVWLGDNEIEITIIHELLHLKFAGLNIPDTTVSEQEAVVESLARTLLKLEQKDEQ
jgi:hypothetical protein